MATVLIKSIHLKCGHKELENEMMLVTSQQNGKQGQFPMTDSKEKP